MAVTTYGSYESKLEDIAKLVNMVADRATPFLKMFLKANEPVENVKREWVDEALVSYKTTLRAAISSTTDSVITLNGGTNAPKRIVDTKTKLLVGDEVMLVSSTISTVTNYYKVFVTRAQNSTTAATYAANKQVLILGNGNAEGFDVDRDDSTKGVRRYNVSQIFDHQLKLTGTAQAGATVGKESTMEKQAAKGLAEVMKKVEVALLRNPVRAFDANTFDNRMTGGFRWAATTSDVGCDSDNNENMAGALIDASLFDRVISTYSDRGGDPSKIGLIVPYAQQSKINALKEARVISGGVKQSDMSINNFVETYNFGNNAQIEIMLTTDIADDEVYFFQKDKVEVKPYKDRGFKREKLGKTGDNDREMIVGEYVCEFHNAPETLFRKYNLAV